MLTFRPTSVRIALRCSVAAAILATTAAAATAQDVPILQAGPPGQAPTVLTPEQAVRIADTRFSPDDVKFMQDMIVHHQQAVEMSALVDARSTLAAIEQAAGRITASQADEIRFMQTWLSERGQAAPTPAAASQHAGHAGMTAAAHAHHDMPGMSTPEQLAALAAARGAAFDRLFLERMIAHHEGALTMARDLLRKPGSAYDPVLFEFANEVINEQQAEIERMSALLGPLANDRRAVLNPGFRDAGQAASNMSLLTTLPKPTGFFDPNNPANLPPPIPARPGATPAPAPAAGAAPTPPRVGERSPMLSFANTDMAFSGNLLAVGNYHGFNLYRLNAQGVPDLASSVICPGGQGDLSIVGDLLIMSVEERRGRTDCGRQGVTGDVSAERFRGLRIFNISDPTRPMQVGQVQTCRGSHTHSVISGPGADGAIIVYASGTSSVRRGEELAGCSDVPGDARTSLFRIDVIEIPVADPSRARIVDSPAVFADPATGNLAGLWRGGSHGEGTQDTSRTDQCHDITVFPSRNLAAGA